MKRCTGLAWEALLCGFLVGAPARSQQLTDGAGAPASLSGPVILLFWADWCAPCHEETNNLAQLKAAAGSIPVIVVPMDSSRRTRRALQHIDASNLRFVADAPIDFMQRMTGGAVGLPASVALDGKGRRCAVKYGAVTAADIVSWRRDCSSGTGR